MNTRTKARAGKAGRKTEVALKATKASKTASELRMNQFIRALMKKMTLEEKIGQLNLLTLGITVTGPVLSCSVEEKVRAGTVGGLFNAITPETTRKLQELAVNETRLGIPLLFGFDVIHGHRTIFPIPLGLAAAWDMDLVQRTARAAALEASADGLNWTFSPMVDIANDPRWGRVCEGAGEDPYLGALIAEAMVRGYQGRDLASPTNLMACVKHFMGYGAAQAGRDYGTADMSRLHMYNLHFPPYKAAVRAGVGSLMPSFNEIDGVPATGNEFLLDKVLRKQWGFEGFAVSDYTAIIEMVQHGMGDEQTVTTLAIKAGTDMDMVSELFIKHLPTLVDIGKVSLTRINKACQRILEAKYKLGLFENPYRKLSPDQIQGMSVKHRELALEAAIKSMVLLKNNGQLLPLRTNEKIAFIGPLVKDQRNLIGSWSAAGDPTQSVSIWQALEEKFGLGKFLYAKGCNLLDDPELLKKLNTHDGQIVLDEKSPDELIAEALQTAEQAEVIVVALGETFGMSGEAACRSEIGLLDNQLRLLKALHKTGRPIVLLLMNGRPLTLAWEDENIDAILETWFGGTVAGPAIVDLLFGDANPSGKLTMTWPLSVGQIPLYYNHKRTGRPLDPDKGHEKYLSQYLDVPNDGVYPFGYGLSYTQFHYSEISLNTLELEPNGTLVASVTVTNTGEFDGTEVVQLYICDLVGSITRPVKELKGFQRVTLKAGASQRVVFELTRNDLKFYGADFKFKAEPGDFKLYIGTNSRDVREANFSLLSSVRRRLRAASAC